MGRNVLDMNKGFVVTLRFLLWNLVWSKDNSDKVLSSRQEAIDASEKAGEKIGTLLTQACANLFLKDYPRKLDEFFTPKYLLNADIDRGFFISIDLCLKEIKRSSKLLKFFRSCSEKEFETWFSNREPITDEVRQKRWNLAAIRHEKRVNHAKEDARRLEEKARLENSRRSETMTRSSRGGSNSVPTDDGFNARRGND